MGSCKTNKLFVVVLCFGLFLFFSREFIIIMMEKDEMDKHYGEYLFYSCVHSIVFFLFSVENVENVRGTKSSRYVHNDGR